MTKNIKIDHTDIDNFIATNRNVSIISIHKDLSSELLSGFNKCRSLGFIEPRGNSYSWTEKGMEVSKFATYKKYLKKMKQNKADMVLNVYQTNTQTQTVSINVDMVFEALKDELRKSEIEELLEILNQEVDEEVKKKSFKEKIKSFGADVSSNVLATILTNPQVFEQLGGLLGK